MVDQVLQSRRYFWTIVPPAVPILLLYIGLGIFIVPPFLSAGNLISIFYSATVLVPAALGMQLLLTLGRFDLSTGATAALAGMVAAIELLSSNSVLVAVILSIAVGVASGALAGYLVAYVKIDPLIATLATMGIGRSLSLISNGGGVIAGLPPSFGILATARILGLPVLTLLACAAIILAIFLTRHAVLFRRLYAAGSNSAAATHSGINVKALTATGYILAGVGAALTGLIQSTRTLSASPQIFESLAIDTIAACIIGGSSLAGGRGSMLGAALGLIAVSSTDNIVIMLDIPVYWRSLAVGILLLSAVIWSPSITYRPKTPRKLKGDLS